MGRCSSRQSVCVDRGAEDRVIEGLRTGWPRAQMWSESPCLGLWPDALVPSHWPGFYFALGIQGEQVHVYEGSGLFLLLGLGVRHWAS